MTNRIIYTSILSVIFFSCKMANEKDIKVKYLGSVNLFYTLGTKNDTSQVYDTLFPASETNKFENLKDLYLSELKNKNSQQKFVFYINDSSIIRDALISINDETLCCTKDTSDYFIEKIDKKNYLLILNKDHVNVFEIDPNSELKVRGRREIKIPSWNIKLGSIIDEKELKDTIKYNNYYSGSSVEYIQIYLKDRNLSISTLKLPDLNQRLVTKITRDISENELNDFMNYIKTNSLFKISDTIDSEEMRNIEINYKGLNISITENKPTYPYKQYFDFNTEKYTLHIYDLYELSKSILPNIGKKYKIVSGHYYEMTTN